MHLPQSLQHAMLYLSLITLLVAPNALAQDSVSSLRVGLATRDISTLDPAFTTGNAMEFIVHQIFNGLVRPAPGTLSTDLGELQGDLAEDWEISEDSRTWTFFLREGVQWQKGYGEVTAEDVKFTFDRLRDPASGAVAASTFQNILEVNVIDPHTVEFVLQQPDAAFHLSLLPRQGPYVVPRRAVEELGEDFALNPVGSGPFQFESYQPQETVLLSSFDEYFRGTPPTDNVEFFLMPETSARTLAFLSGDLAIIEGARSPGWVSDLTTQKPDALLDALQPGSVQTLFLNLTRPPLDDIRVRQAIAYALDREVWREAFGALSGYLWGPVPLEFYGGLGRDDVPQALRYDFDPDRARELLTDAGYPNGFEMKVLMSEREDYLANMLLVQDQLRRVGIDIDVQVVDHTTYHANTRDDLSPMVIFSTTQPPSAFPVLEAFYSSDAIVMKPTANRNFSHYGDVVGSIDEKLEQARGTLTSESQEALLKEIQLDLLTDLPGVPLQSLAMLFARQPWVDLGFNPTAGLSQYTLESAVISAH